MVPSPVNRAIVDRRAIGTLPNSDSRALKWQMGTTSSMAHSVDQMVHLPVACGRGGSYCNVSKGITLLPILGLMNGQPRRPSPWQQNSKNGHMLQAERLRSPTPEKLIRPKNNRTGGPENPTCGRTRMPGKSHWGQACADLWRKSHMKLPIQRGARENP